MSVVNEVGKRATVALRPPLFSLAAFFKGRQDDVSIHLHDAIQELKKRQADPKLRAAVAAYLKDDIPDYFKGDPALYLARHIATPNFETMRFLHLVEATDMRSVIGQYPKDKFVPANALKRALGKLPISLGITKNDDGYTERFEHATVIDFNSANGKPLSEVRTLWHEPLLDFHNGLFESVYKRPVNLVDDSAWVDRHNRGNPRKHYKQFLALFLMHGILFEDLKYADKAERCFVRQIFVPAFKFIERKFGYTPLVVQLTPTSVESDKYWVSYPKETRDIVQGKRLSYTP